MSGPRPNAVVARLAAYDPGHDLPALRAERPGLLELGSNENPYGPSPAALAVIRSAEATLMLRYPDPRAGALRAALSQSLGVAPDGLVFGNGTHELLMLIAQCFAAPGDEVLHSQFGFAVFPIAAAAVGADAVAAPAFPRDHPSQPRGHDLEAMAAALTPRTRIIYLANPNNPTGTCFGAEALQRFLERVPDDVLVVVDEAYGEYVDDPAWCSAASFLARHSNLMVTRTFSKIHGLAGLRVGYGLAHREVVATLERLRESFNLNALAIEAACAALADTTHLDDVRTKTLAQRQHVVEALRRAGRFVHPSQANFVLVDFGDESAASAAEAALRKGGVVVRPMRGYGLPQCLRITLGTARENARWLGLLGA